MSSKFTAEYWKERAEEVRAKAEQVRDPEARDALLQAARSCDLLAERAEDSENTVKEIETAKEEDPAKMTSP